MCVTQITVTNVLALFRPARFASRKPKAHFRVLNVQCKFFERGPPSPPRGGDDRRGRHAEVGGPAAGEQTLYGRFR